MKCWEGQHEVNESDEKELFKTTEKRMFAHCMYCARKVILEKTEEGTYTVAEYNG